MKRSRALAEAGLVFAIVFGILLLGRLDTLSIWYALNPDEAQNAANALRLLRDPLPWRSVNGASNGPLNFFVLMVPFAFGEPISFYWVRAIGLLFVAGTLSCMYLAALRLVSRPIAAVLLAFPTLYYATTTHRDLLSYHSEIVPVFLICVALLIGIRVYERYSFVKAFALANIGVLIAFAKLQAALFSAVFQLIAVVTILAAVARQGKPTFSKYVRILFLTYLPLLLFVVLLVVTDTWGDFYADYIAAGQAYVQPMLDLRAFTNLFIKGGLHTDYASGAASVRFVGFTMLLAIAGFLWVSFGWCRGFFALAPTQPAVVRNILVPAVAILSAMTWWTISRPGREYEHYLYFALVPAFAVTLAPFAFARQVGKDASFMVKATTLGVICVVLAAYASTIDLRRARLGINAQQLVRGSLSLPDRLRDGLFPDGGTWLSWILPSDASLFVWGWAAEWYVFANAYPATRDTIQAGLIPDSRLRRRALADLAAADPLVVIDAVAPGSFMFTERFPYGIELDREFGNRVREQYALINPSSAARGCPAMYVESRHFAKRSTQFVDVDDVQLASFDSVADADVKASGSRDLARLIDKSTFERCEDYWSDGTSTLPVISMRFAPTPLQRIAILNSFGRSGRGATRSLRASFYIEGKLAFATQVALNRYPRWTNIDVPVAGKVDEVRLSDLASDGREVSLNEIIIFKRQ